jgi:LacI family transcriptional regulator
MITIKDVAKHAGVSITTVSYALNGKGKIKEATRKRVQASAEELNYHPNAYARILKKRKSHIIGVFIGDFGGSFYNEILEGIHNAVRNTDYELIVCPESQKIRKILVQHHVDGAIIFNWNIADEILIKLAATNFPIVVLDRNLKGDYLFPLLVDNKKGTKEVFYHLYNQGARRITYVSGALDSFDNKERMTTFIAEAEKNNISVNVYYGSFNEESGYQIGRSIIESNLLPDAVFCANDQMAIGFIRAMQEKNLKAPDDIAIVGFDDILIARYMQPALSTVGTSRFNWGASAASQLIDFLDNGTPICSPRISTWLIERESSVKKIIPFEE